MPVDPISRDEKIDPGSARRFRLALTIGAICFVLIVIAGLLLTGGREGTPTMATAPSNETQSVPARPMK